jgi:signal transduction histidine kinase
MTLVDRAARWVLAAAVFIASYAGAPVVAALNPNAQFFGDPYRSVYTTPAGGRVEVVSGDTLSLPALVTAAACALAVLVARRQRWPLYGAALVGWLAFGMWPAIAVASYYAATTVRRRAELGTYALAAGVAVVAPAFFLDSVSAPLLGYAAVVATTLVGLPLTAGLWVAARREVRSGVRATALGREREQAARFEQARAEERARIAREMHDVVAHQVSLMVLHAGALEVNAPDEATATAAALIRTTGREALTDLREVLGVLRSRDARLDPRPTLEDLDRLVVQSRLAGVPVSRRDEGTARTLPPPVERAAYRVVQEALTNVYKHTGDAATEVVVRYLPDSVEVAVRNAPAVAGEAGGEFPGSGLGLAGLRERVELLGGQFVATRLVAVDSRSWPGCPLWTIVPRPPTRPRQGRHDPGPGRRRRGPRPVRPAADPGSGRRHRGRRRSP